MAGPPARAKAEGRGATAGTAAAEGRPRRGAVMCQSLCPPQRPWHRAGIFPAGAPPPFGSPCRHFVDAPGGRRLLRVFGARCHNRPPASSSSLVSSARPRRPWGPAGAIGTCGHRQGVGGCYGCPGSRVAWGYGRTMGIGVKSSIPAGRDRATRGKL